MSPARKGSRRPRAVANREGRIYRRGSDGRWVGIVYPPSVSGGRPRYVYGKTREEAIGKRDELKAKLAAGDLTGRDVTIREFMETSWFPALEREVRAGELAASTLDSYQDNARKHILPDLGRIPLRQLTPSRIREWKDALAQKPARRQRKKLRPGETTLPAPVLLSPRTVNYCHAILRRALGDAMDDELVTRNVAVIAGKKARGKQAKRSDKAPKLPTGSGLRLRQAMCEDDLWCYWLTVMDMALRRGEGLGLMWKDINWDERTIYLDGTIQRVRRTDPVTGKVTTALVRKKMKTQNSESAMPVGVWLIEALRLHQVQQAERKARARVWAEHGLVFTTGIGTALEPRNVSRSWDAVCAKAGVRIRIHDLRHAAGDLMVDAGIHQRVIQGQLRHARLSTTEIYMHVLEESRRDAADKLDEAVFGDLVAARRGHLRKIAGGAG